MITRLRDWVRGRDPGYGALRRAGRGAIVMPAVFAVGDRMLGNPVVALFSEGVAGDLRDDSLAALQGIELGVVGWYEIMAAALSGVGRVPEPQAADAGQLERLAAVAAESRDDDQAGRGRRVLWVGDHLDAARRLQALVAPPAAVVARDARAR